MKKLSFTLLISILAVLGLKAQLSTANLQAIHNAADPAADTVDVYANGNLLIDDFAFRTAEPFTPVPAGVSITIDVAPDTSTSNASAIATFTVGPLMEDSNYVLIANGVIDTSSFTQNPDAPDISFDLYPTLGQQTGRNGANNVDLLAFHGSTDAPAVDVDARGVGTILNNLVYGNYQGYTNVPAGRYILDVKDSTGATTVASFVADLSGLGGDAAVVFASGFLDDSQGPAFGLFAALANGDVVELPAIQNTMAQIIHNAADPAAEFVDIYVVEQYTGLNNVILSLDNVKFRTATPYTPVPAGVPFKIYVADSTSSSYTDSLAVFNYASGLSATNMYAIIANGVLNPSNFTANPDGESIAFDLYVFDQARIGAQPANEVNVIAFHGATDAPTVDIDIRNFPGTEIDDLTYGNFSSSYASFPPQNVEIDVTNDDGTVVVDSFSATLSLAGGAAVTAFASGFLDDSQGAEFGLFAALPINLGGRYVIPLPKLVTFINEASVFSSLNMYPNPTSDLLRIDYNLKESNDFEIRLVDVNGKIMSAKDLGTVPAGNDRVEFNVSGLSSGTYFVQMLFGQKDFVVKPVIVE